MRLNSTKEIQMFKLYRNLQLSQFRWIRNHPVQYVALNATLLAVLAGYIAYEDRKANRKFEKDMKEEFDRLIKID
jgi:hypothetical protein